MGSDAKSSCPTALQCVFTGLPLGCCVLGLQMCDECDGRGVKVVIRRMGPMVQQMQQPCGKCR